MIRIIEYSKTRKLLRLGFDGTREILITPSHTILTEKGWIKAENIKMGDRIITRHGAQQSAHDIEEIQDVSNNSSMFNLTTIGHHNFIVDEIIAHNFTFMRRLRTMMHQLISIHCMFFSRGGGNGPRCSVEGQPEPGKASSPAGTCAIIGGPSSEHDLGSATGGPGEGLRTKLVRVRMAKISGL